MPYIFSYNDTRRPDVPEFLCVLKSQRCKAHNKTTGVRCSKTCVIGLPYCWIHLLSIKHLKVSDSYLNGESIGKGLFAAMVSDLEADRDDIIFDDNDAQRIICAYDGEVISQSTLNHRYGSDINVRRQRIQSYPPYAVRILNTNTYEDGACKRGSGSLPNHRDSDDPERNAMLVTSNDGVIYVEAIKPIRHGEEILVDYGYNDFDTPFIEYNTKYVGKKSKKVKDAKTIKRQERIREQERIQRAEERAQRQQAINQVERRRSTRLRGR